MIPEISFPSQFKKDMSKLQQTYVERLKGHHVDLRRLREPLAAINPPRRDLQAVSALAHKLAESAATFGFPELSMTARDLYLSAHRYMQPQPDPAKGALLQTEVLSRLQSCERVCQDALHHKPQEALDRMFLPEAAPLTISQGEEDVYVVANPPDRAAAEDAAEQLAQFGYNAYVVVGEEEQFLDTFQKGYMKAAVVFSELSEHDTVLIRKARERNDHVPIVVISPYEDFEARLRAARLGAQGYFSGKLDIIRVMDKIERLSAQCRAVPDYHVLIVDDDDMLTEFYRQALQRTGLKVSVLNDPRDAAHFLTENEVDLLMLDHDMPGCTGYEVASIIRQYDANVSLPILFMSPQEEIDEILAGSGPGIDDFLVKPFLPSQLLTAIRSRARRAAELKSFMVHDTFTGLYNHEHFTDMLSHEIKRAKRTRAKTVYAILDIDSFKQINSTYGHYVGDQIIKMMSHMLRHHLRTTDIIGRVGGETFGIVMPGCDLKNARDSLEKFRVKVTSSFFNVKGQQVRVTFSGGVVLVDAKASADDVIKSADKMLYKAKEQGRNQVVST